MASDLLNVGAQSVLTAQRQLNTTGHNISNANTEGYSRQTVIQGVNDPRQYGGQSYGMGVHPAIQGSSPCGVALKPLELNVSGAFLVLLPLILPLLVKQQNETRSRTK